VRGDFVEK